MSYTHLKNGSDIRGNAAPFKNEEVTLTTDAVKSIAYGLLRFLKEKLKKDKFTIAIGKDSRLTGDKIKDTLSDVFTSQGHTVIYTGLSSTPAMFMILQEESIEVDGSVMITASHLPSHKNGLKFFIKNGGLESEDISFILEHTQPIENEKKTKASETHLDYMCFYSQSLTQLVREKTGLSQPLLGKKISVDAGNGGGGFFASILSALGADVSGSQFLGPNGNFPNHIPNPEDKDAMNSISNRVLETNSDLGIIFDTDVDRAGLVFADGKEINRNKLIALISAIVLQEGKGTIVTDSVTSSGLTDFIEEKGGVHHRFKRGYKNVINESIRLNEMGENSPLAIETSGHAALKENYFLDDGAYLIIKILIELSNLSKKGETLDSLIKDLKEPKEELELRIKITSADFRDSGEKVMEDFAAFAKNEGIEIATPSYEGVRLNFGGEFKGWALLRMSLHDPILPLNIESDQMGGVAKIHKIISDFLSSYDFLDKQTYLLP